MRKMTRYIIAASLVTAGCLMWILSSHTYSLLILGNMLICSQIFIIDPSELRKPIRFAIPNWKTKNFFTTINTILIIFIFFILLGEIPDQGRALIGKWYFTGAVWLIGLASLAKRYVEENENAQQKNQSNRE